LSLGFGSLTSPLGLAIVFGGISVLLRMAICEEERVLLRGNGTRFDAYRRRVPTLLPRLSPVPFPGWARVTPSIVEAGRATVAPAAFVVAACGVALIGLPAAPFVYLALGFGWALQLAIVEFGRHKEIGKPE
jgi:hypothetical protein